MQADGESSGGNIANAIVIPMIAVVAIAVASVFGLMIWSSHVSDQTAEQSQRQLLKGAIDLQLDQMSKQQVGTVVWDQAYFKTSGTLLDYSWIHDNIGLWLNNNHGFTRSLLIDRNRDTVFSYDRSMLTAWQTPALMDQLASAIAKVRAKYIIAFKYTPSGLFEFNPDTQKNSRSFSETGLVAMDGETYLFTAAAFVQEISTVTAVRRPPAVLISFKNLGHQNLRDIELISGLDEITLARGNDGASGTAAIALRDPTGQTIGYLQWVPKRPGTEMLERVTPVLVILALAIVGLTIGVIDFTRQTARRLSTSQAKALHAAKHDALSGLPNREQFNHLLSEELERAQTETDGTAVIYIDLDHFKDINDTMGHAAGDDVIKAVAARLQAVVPHDSVVARISGDEFAMMLAHCDSRDWLEHMLTRIQDQLVHPIRINSSEIYVSLSMGAAIAPVDGTDPGELLRKADIALYDAKENGRGRWSYFDPSMQEQVQTKDKMSRELRKAIDNDELDVAYQPQSDRNAKRIVGIEALARWTQPGIGAIPPSSFIPIAEETGLINDLGFWILRRACRDAHRWPDLIVSVNASPTQFKHPRFVEKLMATLEEFNMPPQRLEIEVTESVFAGRDEIILKALKRLKDLGVKVALDDFGSGYSSLGYLRRFPFDTLKIDRDFISALDQSSEARAILTSIVQLGAALGMTTVAEGIETLEQLDFLRENGCDRMQGYYLSRPLNAEALSEFLADYRMQAAMKAAHLQGPSLIAADA